MRLPLVIACLLLVLTGCSFGTKPEPAAVKPLDFAKPEVPKVTVADKAGDIDARSMGYAAAAVTVAKEKIEENKPKVAARELDVALANLIKPTIDQVQSARRRADAGKDETYTAHIRKAEELQKKSDEAWAAFQLEKGKNDLLQKQIEANLAKQKAEADARQKADDAKAVQDRRNALASDCRLWGGILFAAGLVCFALSRYLPINKATAPICMTLGGTIAALPLVLDQVLDWEYLVPTVVGFVLFALVVVLAHWFMIHRHATKAAGQA